MHYQADLIFVEDSTTLDKETHEILDENDLLVGGMMHGASPPLGPNCLYLPPSTTINTASETWFNDDMFSTHRKLGTVQSGCLHIGPAQFRDPRKPPGC